MINLVSDPDVKETNTSKALALIIPAETVLSLDPLVLTFTPTSAKEIRNILSKYLQNESRRTKARKNDQSPAHSIKGEDFNANKLHTS